MKVFCDVNYLTSTNYLDMLELFTVPQIENENFIFQQNGALTHFSKIVQDFLNQKFSCRGIGRRGLKAGPSHSSDLLPMDFYLWGSPVYRERIMNEEHLIQQIQEAVALITTEILHNVWQCVYTFWFL